MGAKCSSATSCRIVGPAVERLEVVVDRLMVVAQRGCRQAEDLGLGIGPPAPSLHVEALAWCASSTIKRSGRSQGNLSMRRTSVFARMLPGISATARWEPRGGLIPYSPVSPRHVERRTELAHEARACGPARARCGHFSSCAGRSCPQPTSCPRPSAAGSTRSGSSSGARAVRARPLRWYSRSMSVFLSKHSKALQCIAVPGIALHRKAVHSKARHCRA